MGAPRYSGCDSSAGVLSGDAGASATAPGGPSDVMVTVPVVVPVAVPGPVLVPVRVSVPGTAVVAAFPLTVAAVARPG